MLGKIIIIVLIFSAALLYGVIVATGKAEREKDDKEQEEFLGKYKK